MSSVDINTAKLAYKGETEADLLFNMAKAFGCRRIYKYANDFGDKITHTDYKIVMAPGDAQEQALFTSHLVHNVVLVFRDGRIVNENV
jgi:hypothetical protein